MSHESNDGAARSEFFFFLNYRRRRRNHNLLDFMNASAFFAPLHLKDEPVLLANLSGDIRFNRLLGTARENIKLHQLSNEHVSLQSELCRELPDDDRWLNVDDFLWFHFRLDGHQGGRSIGPGSRGDQC